MKIKTFRGKMGNNTAERIRLSTNDGLTGYQIKSLKIISETPGIGDTDHVLQVFSTDNYNFGSPFSALTVDFTNPTLMAVAFFRQDADAANITARMSETVIFDNTKVNQDIWITHQDARGSSIMCNYYLELEQVKLDLNEATVATLKDLRGAQ